MCFPSHEEREGWQEKHQDYTCRSCMYHQTAFFEIVRLLLTIISTSLISSEILASAGIRSVTASLKLVCEVLNAGGTRIPNQFKGLCVMFDLLCEPLEGNETLSESSLSSTPSEAQTISSALGFVVEK